MYVMNIYDRVVPNFATDTLWVLSVGIILVLFADTVLKLLRHFFIDKAASKTDILMSSAIMDNPSTPTRTSMGRPPTPPSSHRRGGEGGSSSSGTQPAVQPTLGEQQGPTTNDVVYSELMEQRRITAELQRDNIRLMGAATASYHGLYQEGRKVISEASQNSTEEKRLLEAYANQAHEAEMIRVRDLEMSEAARAREALSEGNAER